MTLAYIIIIHTCSDEAFSLHNYPKYKPSIKIDESRISESWDTSTTNTSSNSHHSCPFTGPLLLPFFFPFVFFTVLSPISSLEYQLSGFPECHQVCYKWHVPLSHSTVLPHWGTFIAK